MGISESPSPAVLVPLGLWTPQYLRADAAAFLMPTAAYTIATWADLKRRRLEMMVTMFAGTLICTAVTRAVSAPSVHSISLHAELAAFAGHLAVWGASDWCLALV